MIIVVKNNQKLYDSYDFANFTDIFILDISNRKLFMLSWFTSFLISV